MVTERTQQKRTRVRLKPLEEQVVVITGATSGIGLATARQAARRGATLVLVSRNESALEQLTAELKATGTRAAWVCVDVADEEGVDLVAEEAVRHFGVFDAWVNNAGVSIYGRITEVSVEDQRRLFETNVWGVVNGSRAAAEHLRDRGGAIINVGSILSDRAIPLQGTYSASKHAVKGFTDALRMELERDGAPISVTLIKPSAIDTPYRRHARNYLEVEPKNPPPVYDAELVARAILHAAEHPVRDLTVGGGGRMLSLMGAIAPRMTDRYMEWAMFEGQKTDLPASHDKESLHEPGDEKELRVQGGYMGHVRRTSLYNLAAQHPVTVAAGAAFLGALVGAAWYAADADRRARLLRRAEPSWLPSSRGLRRRFSKWEPLQRLRDRW